MGMISMEDGRVLKARIFDLSEKSAKEALFGMVDILEHHPSVLAQVFQMILEDAVQYTEHLKITQKRA